MKNIVFLLLLFIMLRPDALAEEGDNGSPATDGYSGLYYEKSSNQYFINNRISFSIRPTEDEKYLDKIQYSVDNGPYAEYTGEIKFETDGFHVVRFKAVDPVLNWSPIQTFRIYVDNSSPESSANWLGKTWSNGQKIFVNKDSKLVMSAQDNLSGVSKILWKKLEDESFNTFKNHQSFPQGEYVLELAAIDKVGNAESWKKVAFVVDGLPPETKAQIKGNSYVQNNKTFIDKGTFISLNGEDPHSGVNRIEYKINGGPTAIYSSRISVEDPITKIEFRSVDNVDNTEDWKSMTVYLDSTPPKLSLNNSGQFQKIAGKYYARKGFKVSATIADEESGASTILVGNDRTNKALNKEFVFDQPGEHSLFVSAEDNVGNTANYVSYNIVVDETPPGSKMESSNPLVKKDEVYLSSLPNKLDFSAIDDGVGVDYIEISYDGKIFQKIQAPIDLATWKTDKRKIYYRATDKLGNMEKVNEMMVYVRKQGPKVDLFVEKGDLPGVSLSKLKDGEKSTPAAMPSAMPAPVRAPASVQKKEVKKQ